jgi:dTDP-4-dehydrorhamnose 3,5-epimerase/CDP-3, 6-dideoxy-D-glycero-D-glycero-4-hexulose-5-epimerase
MEFTEELLPGTWLIKFKSFEDARGTFIKTFARTLFEYNNAYLDVQEEYYSVSNKNVIRGMHFQNPPHDHSKLVYCPIGAVDDVLLDLRSGSGYGKVANVRLSQDKPFLVFMPKGIAHGFRSLEDGSMMVYKTSSEYEQAADSGVRWDSFGYDWGLDQPTMSDRDRMHVSFKNFLTPF